MKTFSTEPAPYRPCPARQARTDRIRASEGDFLGRPRGLTFLLTTEKWERFSYYGMRALLVLDRYLTRSLEAGLPFEPLFVLALFTLIPGNGAFAQHLDRGRRPLRAGRPSGQDVMAALAQSSSELWSG
jgi:hypothetical protein